MNHALKTLQLMVASGLDFYASLKAVSDHFNVNKERLASEFDAENNDQGRDQDE
jgi:hypothetical protein